MRTPRTMLAAVGLMSLMAAPCTAGPALRVAYLDDAATTITLAAAEHLPLGGGSAALPEPGETVTVDTHAWMLFLEAAAGVAFSTQDDEDDTPTVSASVGVLRRLGSSFPDRVGLLFVSSFEPWGAGPALRAEALRAFALEVGGHWYEETEGFHAYGALEVSLAFLGDVF